MKYISLPGLWQAERRCSIGGRTWAGGVFHALGALLIKSPSRWESSDVQCTCVTHLGAHQVQLDGIDLMMTRSEHIWCPADQVTIKVLMLDVLTVMLSGTNLMVPCWNWFCHSNRISIKTVIFFLPDEADALDLQGVRKSHFQNCWT